MYYFCTYFDHNYLNKGLALYQSLTEQCDSFTLYILCMDDECYQVLSRMRLPGIIMISLEDFEKGDQDLCNAKKNRSLIEYYFTCTPSLPLYILNHYPQVDIITYLDSDLYFFSSPGPIYSELGSDSVLIVGHRFPEYLRDREIYGIYNVGYLSFRKDKYGLECLKWWRDKCIEWCYDRYEGDRFADQKYLDTWTRQFNNVVVLKHEGAGLAPWNLSNYKLTADNDKIMVNNRELIFYHFHGLKKISKRSYDTNLSEYKVRPTRLIRGFYKSYINVLEKYDRELGQARKNDYASIREKKPGTGSGNSRFSALINKIKDVKSKAYKLYVGDMIRV